MTLQQALCLGEPGEITEQQWQPLRWAPDAGKGQVFTEQLLGQIIHYVTYHPVPLGEKKNTQLLSHTRDTLFEADKIILKMTAL